MYKCDLDRLSEKIKTFSKFGDTGNGGITRLSLSDEALAAREEFCERLKKLGANIVTDDMANIYATIPGSENLPDILSGSHLDSVRQGGNYDGVLGVLSAMEAVETIVTDKIPHRHPITVVVWTNEEGARFEPAMMSSGVLCGKFKKEDMLNSEAKDIPGYYFKDALEKSGYKGSEENRMKKYTEYTDEELVELLRQGDTEVMDYLLEKYKFVVRQKARVLYLAGGEADDLIQEGMIGLFKAIRDYRGDKEASFYTFAQLCVDRQMYNAIQSSTRQKHQPLNSYIYLSEQYGENEEHLGDNWGENPESIIIDQENVQDLEQEITATLSPMENQVLEYYLAGNGYGEIARIMGKTPKSIDNALQRIRIKIREQLEQYQK